LIENHDVFTGYIHDVISRRPGHWVSK